MRSLQSHPQEVESPDGAATGISLVAAGTDAVATVLQPIAGDPAPKDGAAATPSQTITANSIAASTASEGTFVTFDPGRKHLARIVAVNSKKVSVRRFDKKSGNWRTKTEALERKVCIPLTAEEAETSFPGSVAAWDKTAQSPTRDDGKVTRRMSRNQATSPVAAETFPSVADFVSAYNDKKKTIDDLTNKFVDKVAEAKQAQDDIIPHLAFMQSLLSKKGVNHHLVIAARKQGHKIPWWTEYYEFYKGKLWESLRTMERRIAAYRNDPTAPEPKPERNSTPRLTKAEQKALIEGNHRAVEIVKAVEAGRDAKKEISEFKVVMDAKRLDDILQVYEREPDYKGILSSVLQTIAHMRASLPDAFVKTVGELTKPCSFKIDSAAVTSEDGDAKPAVVRLSNSTVSTKQTRRQTAPVPQTPPEFVPLDAGKKYTVRVAAAGGYGIFEPGSPVCLQKHPTQDSAWDAIEAVNALSAAAAQQNY